MFCLDEHDREPAFTGPNDRTLAHAERSQGRLVPFVRLDLTAQPLEEARRCLDLGARGIKLHPRAQAFALSDERLQPIFASPSSATSRSSSTAGAACPRSRRTSRRSYGATTASGSSSRTPGSPTWPDSPADSAVSPECSSTRRSGAASISSISTARSRPSRCCTHPTTRTVDSRTRCSWQSGRRSSPASTTSSCGSCSAAPPAGCRRAKRSSPCPDRGDRRRSSSR